MTAEIEACPDWQGLYAGILENPFDDLRRLVAADWLEERAQLVPCDYRRDGLPDFPCTGGQVQDTVKLGTHADGIEVWGKGWRDCPKCNGVGFVSDGLAERAEFIRLQVECHGAPITNSQDMSYAEWFTKRARIRDLWAEFGDAWRKPFAETATRLGFTVRTRLGEPEHENESSLARTWATFSKGFLDEFRCELSSWLRVGPELVSLFPVIFVGFTDREPATHDERRTIDKRSWPPRRPFWTSHHGDGWMVERRYRHLIPAAVFDLLPFDPNDQPPGIDNSLRSVRYYPDTASAIQALSTAALLWARAVSTPTARTGSAGTSG